MADVLSYETPSEHGFSRIARLHYLLGICEICAGPFVAIVGLVMSADADMDGPFAFPLAEFLQGLFYITLALYLVILAIMNFLSGALIAARRNRGLSVNVAIVNCLFVPIGTVVGVQTFRFLRREEIKKQYEVSAG